MTAETKVHELKTWPEYYEKVESGEKTFEVRKLDRFFSVGDTLILKEWSPVRWQDTGGYSGRQVERKVSYLMNGGKWDIPEGICIMGLSAATPPDVEQCLKERLIKRFQKLVLGEFDDGNRFFLPECDATELANWALEEMYQAGQSAVQDATPQDFEEAGGYYYELFKFFSDNHNLILVDSEIQDIIHAVEGFNNNPVRKIIKRHLVESPEECDNIDKELSTLRSELSAAQEENKRLNGEILKMHKEGRKRGSNLRKYYNKKINDLLQQLPTPPESGEQTK